MGEYLQTSRIAISYRLIQGDCTCRVANYVDHVTFLSELSPKRRLKIVRFFHCYIILLFTVLNLMPVNTAFMVSSP